MSDALLACDVLVVGMGPAGLAAAIAARENGAEVVCLDLHPRAGGQYAMQPASAESPFQDAPQVVAGRAAEARCRALGVRLVNDAEVFWAEPGYTVYARQGEGALTIRATAVVAASGAMERPIPFKGWTLPGVMAAGAAQRLIKANGTPPGRKVVLAGSGPFLLAVADTFAKAGLGLSAYVERRRPDPGFLGPFLHHPGRIGEALGLLRGLGRTRARRHFGHVVVEAMGESRVEAVRIAPVGADGMPVLDRAFRLNDVDTLCIGYGFQPVIDLTALLKARHDFDATLGGWHCVVDPQTQATDIPGLFAAGETTGLGGALPARLSGRLAGLAAAEAAGRPVPAAQRMGEARALTRARAFAARLAALFPFPADLADSLPRDEVVCRCEDVALSSIDAAIDDGATDLFSVKMWTRAGMGPCQGRICGSALARIVTSRCGGTPEAAGYNRPHMPLRPVPLSIVDRALDLAADADESAAKPGETA
ncbi:FAD-dependent oxidoreductase [Ensifer soli]|uniref:FAD-dependent oxidoreductase n=1 Tax=Ciceribacter sp. sgz301302 TaxID=3342379 RepID=UPI0035BABA65